MNLTFHKLTFIYTYFIYIYTYLFIYNFFSGTIIRSVVIFCPFDYESLQLIFICSNHCSIILITCSGIVYFMRITTTWTPIRSFILINIVIIANVLESNSHLTELSTLSKFNFRATAKVFLIVAVIWYFLLVALCLINYCRNNNIKKGYSFFQLFQFVKKSLLPISNSEVILRCILF